MKNTITFLLILFSFQLFSQKVEKPSLLISQNFLGIRSGFNPFANESTDKVQLYAGSAIGLLIPQKKRKYIAFELSGYFGGETSGISKINKFIIAGRFEKGKYLEYEKGSPLRIRLGGAIRYSYGNQDETTSDFRNFPVDFRRHAIELAFTPHFEFRFKKKLFFDVGPNVSLLAFGREVRQTNDPTLTERQQTSSSFVLQGGGLLLRLSLGYRF